MFAGDRLQLICALTLALLCCNVNAQTINLNNICLLLPSGQMIVDTSSCGSYYLCNNGIATAQSCQPNFYFSKDQQGCMPASQVNCGSSSTDDACKGYSVGTWAPVSGSCSGYYYCSASGPKRSNCADGQHFNPTAQMCQYASQYPCGETNPGGNEPGNGGTIVTTINLCTYIRNGIYFGSAGSCAAWNICKDNVITTNNCQTPLVFNVAKGLCDYTSNTNCAQVTHDPQLTTVSPSYGGPCTDYGNTTAATACNQYYWCNSVSYNLQQCPGGQFWDTKSEKCMSRLNAYNGNCDRCLGSKKSFVNAMSNTACNGYLYCVDGAQQSTGFCSAGSFFNEIAGACEVGLEPKFGCCNPNWNGTPVDTTIGSTVSGGTSGSTVSGETSESTVSGETSESTVSSEATTTVDPNA